MLREGSSRSLQVCVSFRFVFSINEDPRESPEPRNASGLEFRESEGPQVESLSFRESLISGPVSALMTEEPTVEVRGGLRRRSGGALCLRRPLGLVPWSLHESALRLPGDWAVLLGRWGAMTGDWPAAREATCQFCVAGGAEQMHVRRGDSLGVPSPPREPEPCLRRSDSGHSV